MFVRVAVVGGGRVGVGSAALLARAGHEVVLVERDEARRVQLASGAVPFREPLLAGVWTRLVSEGSVRVSRALDDSWALDQVWVAVGTPSAFDGRADLRQVESVVNELQNMAPGLCVMRSTVPAGTGARIEEKLSPAGWRYVSHPEFLREGHALEDLESPSRLVIGAAHLADAATLLSAYDPVPAVPVITTDLASAELSKLASNAFLACRVSFVNEMSLLADRVGADIETVTHVMGLDPRIGPDYLRAGIGYGGSCFPKDARALWSLGEDGGVELALLRAVVEVNRRMPEALLMKLWQAAGYRLEGKRAAVWGLTFKPDTDDLKESPAIAVVDLMLKAGLVVQVHDPVARALPWPEHVVRRHATALEAVRDADALVLCTEWPEYVDADPGAVVRSMATSRIVVDGRNALDAAAWTAAGAEYKAIGRVVRRGSA